MSLEFKNIGQLSFLDARRYQEDLLEKRLRDEVPDTILFCEHPATLSLGWRTQAEDIGFSEAEWAERGVEVVRASRGGGPTFHGPGQLLVYPVINLRERGIGIKDFVEKVLQAFSEVLTDIGVACELELNPAALWVKNGKDRAKIAAVGLRILRGVTNHGFSLNVSSNLDIFSMFNPCGEKGVRYTSLAEIFGSEAPDLKKIEELLMLKFSDIFEI